MSHVDAPPTCPLCRAEKITPWYLDDELCWIAECSICALPMVVLRAHDREPAPEVKGALHERLAGVVAEHFTFEHWVDDRMRQIPDHYHAHARPDGGFFGHAGLRRGAAADGPDASNGPDASPGPDVSPDPDAAHGPDASNGPDVPSAP
ncbi:hypothetical protein [Iamia sp.]|uniref:hypothetical protein n=1 Tax=Iamia sp. TaxID=2722710 RepID=UPI002C0CA5A9|nr:hypothetical protein [Iamia sp.]HXH58107.1 hypothetical protein [Iamia sp.]